jgi:hypothetical protein
LERGQQIGRSHCAASYYRIKEYIQPRTQGPRLREATAETLDRLQLQLRQELPTLSAKSINLCMDGVTGPIREAYRLGQIPHNPAWKFRGLKNNSKQRGILSTAERIRAGSVKQGRYLHVAWYVFHPHHRFQVAALPLPLHSGLEVQHGRMLEKENRQGAFKRDYKAVFAVEPFPPVVR